MNNLIYNYKHKDTHHIIELIFVEGTAAGQPYLFGAGAEKQAIHINNFYIAKFQTTQALWQHVMADEFKHWGHAGDTNPAEHVAWYDITSKAGFLDRINNSDMMRHISNLLPQNGATFRLPSESEWEYAARGGKNWQDDFMFAGSNSPDDVAWYLNNSSGKTHPVGLKRPNQLGLHDMNGNVWEWCQDSFIRDATYIPKDGSAYEGPGTDRVLRGGCHHNGAVHCTSTKRYEITPEANDGCIGFRLALSA
ncbi:MAG: formylglycine-generating enzyme family protein [Bacteroidota bacterium]